MPLYDYICPSCHSYDTLLLDKPKKRRRCPYCGRSDMIKQIPNLGGYKVNGDNSSSTRPVASGSFKRGPKK